MEHKAHFVYDLYNVQTTFNPPSLPKRLCKITQFREYRFKSIYGGFASGTFATTGNGLLTLTFWQGDSDIGGLPLLQIPMLIANKASASTFGRGAVTAGGIAFYQGKGTDFFNVIDRSGSGHVTTFTKALDIDIVCDSMTLDITWDTNQLAPYPAFLASRAFTHPCRMYHENNYEAYA
jgi:hypothetical protein